MIEAYYSQTVSKFDVRVVGEFFKLKYGDNLMVSSVETEAEKALNLISYKLYTPLQCLNALHMSLYSLVHKQIKNFQYEFFRVN